MRRLLLPVAVIGALLLAAGSIWSFAARAEEVHPGVTALLVAGTVLCLGAVNAWIGVERRPGGLAVPEGTQLPTPLWWGYVMAVGIADALAGLFASLPMAGVGGLLFLVALFGMGAAQGQPPLSPDRSTVVAARRIRAFAERHAGDQPADQAGASVEAAAEHVGRGVVRIVLVGADGAFGDLVVRGEERAQEAIELAGGTQVDPAAREFSARLRTGPYEWRRMAGIQLGGGR